MVITINECRHYYTAYGSVLICTFGEESIARNVFESSWGPAYVMNCPLSHISKQYEDHVP